VAFTAAVMYLSVPGTDLFSWHPTCMAVGFVLLANQAIMVFSKESGLFPTSTRNGIYQILAQNNPQSL
jgi:hypothetical protein